LGRRDVVEGADGTRREHAAAAPRARRRPCRRDGPVNLEREVKLEASPAFRLPDLDVNGFHAGPRSEERLVTTYLDTVDLRIVRWGASLRHRTGEGWTVKLPVGRDGDLLERAEHVFPGDDPA